MGAGLLRIDSNGSVGLVPGTTAVSDNGSTGFQWLTFDNINHNVDPGAANLFVSLNAGAGGPSSDRVYAIEYSFVVDGPRY